MAVQQNAAKSAPRNSKKWKGGLPVKAPVQSQPAKPKSKSRVTFMDAIEAIKAGLRRVIHIGSYCALYPVAQLNMAGAPNQTFAICSVFLVYLAAFFIDRGGMLKKQGDKDGRIIYRVGLFIILVNIINAGSNIAHITGTQHEAAAGARNRAELQNEELSNAKAAIKTNEDRRAAQAFVPGVGERTVEAIEHDIGELTTQNSQNWADSQNCSQVNPRSRAQKDLCGKVQALGGVKSAALARDKFDREHIKLVADRDAIMKEIAGSGDAPASSDAFGDSVKSIAPVLGFSISDTFKNALTPLKGWIWAGALELAAAFAPAVLSGLLAHILGLDPARPQPKVEVKAIRPKGEFKLLPVFKKDDEIAGVEDETPLDPGKIPRQPQLEDVLEEFYTEELESHDESRTGGRDLHEWYCVFCDRKGYVPVNLTRFGTAIKSVRGVTYAGHPTKPKYKLRLQRAQLRVVN